MKTTEILDSNGIRILRTASGMSESALARALGVSQTVVRNLENGQNHDVLTLRTVARLANILGTDIRHIVSAGVEQADPTSDDIRAEALIIDAAPYPLAAQEIAEAFQWPLRRPGCPDVVREAPRAELTGVHR